jgi:phage terminase large subunit
MADLAAMGATIRRWREEPLTWLAENFPDLALDPWQVDALVAFARQDVAVFRLALQACVGVGKTMILALVGLHFLGCQGERGEHPKGAAIAVTWANLMQNLWPEFARLMARSRFYSAAFTWTHSKIFANDHAETWVLRARSFPKSANSDEAGKTLSGLHSKYVLVLVDESGGVPPSLGRTSEQVLANCTFGRVVQAGNPISRDSMLFAAASSLRHLWHVIRVTGDPDDPRRSSRIDLAWAREQIASYGRSNPWVECYILGLFPSASFNTLLTTEEVEAAMHRHLPESTYVWSQRRLGVDVARFGDDRSVIFPRQGLASFRPIVMRNARTTDIAARVATAIATWNADLTLVDDTGHWGHGVIDNLLAAGCQVMPIVFSDPALDPRFRNRRCEMHMALAEFVKRGGALPNLPELVAELTVPTYTFVNGKFQLEEKDQIKKRLGRSPDLADALALSFAMPDQPRHLDASGRAGVGKVLRDFDPYDGVR